MAPYLGATTYPTALGLRVLSKDKMKLLSTLELVIEKAGNLAQSKRIRNLGMY